MSSSSSSSAPLGPKKKPSCDCDCCEDQVIPTACAPETPNSVVLKTGQFTFNLPLLSVSGIGIASWSFGLDYLSENEVDGLLGKEFNYPQYDHLVELPGGDIDLITGHNTIERFIKVGDTYSSADNNTSAVLTKSGTGEEEVFHLTGSSGSVVTFFGFDELVETPGQLKRKADHYGNTLNYQWSVSGDVNVLDKVIDGYGREVSYRYCTPPSSSSSSSGTGSLRLCEIEDFLGRKLKFQYDVHGRLVAVVTPAILRAAEGNEFPGGTAYVFRYRSAISSSSSSSGSDDPDDLVNIWYPNQVMPYLNTVTRQVDVEALYAAADGGSASAAPRYTVTYDEERRVVEETVGDLTNEVGGSYLFDYSGPDLPKTNEIDGTDSIVSETVLTDRNGNEVAYFFNSAEMVVCQEVRTNRNKIEISTGATPSAYVTWTKYDAHNRILEQVMPAGNAVINEYDDGMVDFGSGPVLYARRRGLLLKTTRTPGNTHSLNAPTRSGSGPTGEVQEQLVRTYFYDPIYNRSCATIEERGNPIDAPSTYFTPQNGGTTPTNADRSRYATITYFDYQQNDLNTIKNNTALQNMLFPGDVGAASKIETLIDLVDVQMKATDGTGGIPTGFEIDLGDINGDGTGNGDSSGLPASPMVGNVVKVKHPDVRLLTENTGGDPWQWTTQQRVELFTFNGRGQITTHTDPEGNITVNVRYPFNDPEGDGKFIAVDASGKQYGRSREVHVDADPNDVMSLVGADGDLIDFRTDVYPRDSRTNTPGIYQDLITRYEGGTSSGAGGCSSCAYDPLGNPLAMTDPRGFTTIFRRNEMGEVYQTLAPKPYEYKSEIHYDANRNVIRRDTEDVGVRFDCDDPASAGYAHFTPCTPGSPGSAGSLGGVAHVPTLSGPGGDIRPGWFTNLYMFDLLDNMIEEDVDATGSHPSSLVTQYTYDANQNLILMTKPEGNTVEYDYDERNLRIAERVGRDAEEGEDGAITLYFHDRNGNLLDVIGPADRGTTSGTELTGTIEDAFGSGTQLVHTGDWLVENTYDGFDRLIKATDAVGNVGNSFHDPNGRVVESNRFGPVGGATPTDRTGTTNEKLAEAFTRFDEAGRAYESQQTVLLAEGTAVPSSRTITHTGGGLATNSTTNSHTAIADLTDDETNYVLSRTVHDSAGRVIITAQDNGSLTHMTYDGANRTITVTDALGNFVESTYDGNGNVIHANRTEKCTISLPDDGVITDETFESAMFYDCLNRLVISASQGADGTLNADIHDAESETLFTLIGYDSRGNTVVTIDPKRNTMIAVYDGASRPVESHQHLRKLGEGDNPPEGNKTFLAAGGGVIRTITFYDGNSRVKQLMDDRGAPTNYTYDTLDRQVSMIFQDGSTRTSDYNAASDVIQYIDENGSEFDYTYDPLGRRTACAIAPAEGVAGHDGDTTRGTTAQAFQYDGLSRMTLASDTTTIDDASPQIASVLTVYDSLSRVLEESQEFDSIDDRYITNSAFTSYPATQFTFPDDRQISNAYDALYRRILVEETSGGADIATWQFFGPGRVAEVVLGNGLICTMMNNTRTHSAVQA